MNYKNLLKEVSGLLDQARSKVVRYINTLIVETYWHIGKLIVDEEQKGRKKARYGEHLITRLSDDLMKRYGKGFNARNLWWMRQFYSTYPKLYALRAESRASENAKLLRDGLSWTHFRVLLEVKDLLARQFYEIETIKNRWSTRELERQIDSMLFERLSLSKDKKRGLKLAKRGQIITKPEDAVKDPYVLEFLGLLEKNYYTESQLEQKLINHLQEFLLELGRGFSFVSRQKRITIDNEHYYVDLVFYHRILKCFVLIDLKVGRLEHKDVGQMNFYLNYIKENEMPKGENPPIGIILCTESRHSFVFVKYALGGLSNKVFVSRYKLYLPTKKELEDEIKGEYAQLRITARSKI